LAYPVGADVLLDSSHGARGVFDAVLTISADGLVTACDVVSSLGSERVDQVICRKARTLMRYRPAFVNGRVAMSTTHLRFRLGD
jgi:adenine/guanine phosphoribosyltransferase-like PRPP-binding protein